jgi:DNA-binding transcriptional LysR family regulator
MIDNRMLSLTHREADIALRPTHAPPESAVGRRVAAVTAAAYANPRRLPGAPAEIAPDQLLHLPWIGWEEGGGPVRLMGWLSRNGFAEQVVYRANSMLNQVTACAAGVGVALLPCFLGESQDGLERVLPPQRALETELWLLTHRDVRRTARVRALLDFLYDELRTWRPRFEGPPPAQP